MNAWDRRPEETSKAYAAFCAYRDLGPARSLASAYRLHYGSKAASIPGYFTAWSAAFDWVARCQAWDAHEDALKTEARLKVRERAREVLMERALDLVNKLVDVALHDDDAASNQQVKAIVEALNRAGVTAPVKVEHEHRHRVELREHLEKVDELSPEEALKLYRESLH